MYAIIIQPSSGITPENYMQCIGEKAIFCDDIKGVKQVKYEKEDKWVVDPNAGVTYEEIQNLQDNSVIFVNNLDSIRIL